MNSIDDPNETAKKLAESTAAKHTGKPAGERDLLAEVAETDASVIDAMPRVERAAFRRELLSAIRRATWAAERLADIDNEENATEPEEDEEEPLTEPGLTPALALRSDGTVLISPQYVEGANLEGREVWTGVALSLAESCDALDAMNDAACDAAAHIGGRLIALARKKKAKDEGGNGDE
jgi:hypothetical protein